MSRSLLRLPLQGAKASMGVGTRYRLAPRQDDLRFATKQPGSWDASVLEDEDVDVEVTGHSQADAVSSRDPWTWVPEPGPAHYEEFYGLVGAQKWKAKWWNPSTGVPQQPQRQAMVQAQIAELVASGQPKEEIYRAIREAYDVADNKED
ncbi:unnamed protein product [Cladocopium goreaui]|uniref:Pentatricopeptide repeat-containing protein, chloroplastic n=1 Tax=Cladocopium goreaui TaxID=2562237 RepID=A0A9P1BYZ6_9DINO|nr:unnamed protein product [Cladocopium goreaui]